MTNHEKKIELLENEIELLKEEINMRDQQMFYQLLNIVDNLKIEVNEIKQMAYGLVGEIA